MVPPSVPEKRVLGGGQLPFVERNFDDPEIVEKRGDSASRIDFSAP